MSAPRPLRSFTLIELLVLFTLIAAVTAVGLPYLLDGKRLANETHAITALRAISSQQELFRTKELGERGAGYASLAELEAAGLIEADLGSGHKAGYAFEVAPNARDPEAGWHGVANPLVPGASGRRSFVINQAGVLYASDRRIALDRARCQIPTSAIPVD